MTTEREIELEGKLAAGLRRELIHLNRAVRAENKLRIATKNLIYLKNHFSVMIFNTVVRLDENGVVTSITSGDYMKTCSYLKKKIEKSLSQITGEKVTDRTLKLVLSDHWFEEIKSGRKTHEYRAMSEYWEKRFNYTPQIDGIYKPGSQLLDFPYDKVEFQKAYRKNAEKMSFFIEKVTLERGRETDLKYDGGVFDIKLGERIK